MAQKQTQAEAGYRRGDPISHCGICVYYLGKRCSQVMGTINPYAVSDLFRPEQNPFGATLNPNEKRAIQAMAADASDRSSLVGG